MSGHSFNERNGHCDNCGVHRDDCLHEEFRADNWRMAVCYVMVKTLKE